jgi:integrase
MSKIIALLTNEHASAHVLSLKKKYSTPNIYDANGDLSKRWYVYYSFRNPETDKLERQTHIYAGVNKFKTLRERKNAIKILAQAVENILESGYNPYEDEEIVSTGEEKKYTIEDAITFSLELKKNTLKENSFRDYRVRIKSFEKWLYANGFENRTINSVDKKTIVTFLNSVLSTTSAKNRNNTRAILSMFFQSLEDNDIIPDNFVKKINVLKSNPERNKTYSSTQEVDIFNYLKSNDELMLLFIQFISYNHLRPVEVVRLQIKDVNVKDRRLYVRAKNKAVKVKIIPEILLSTLPNLDKFNPESYLFTPNGIGQDWTTNETDKRDYFSKRFKKVKDSLGLGKDYGLYSFRHTFITKLYHEFVKNSTPFEAKSKLMLITGHETMVALEKYLRDIDAVLPDDYSQHINNAQ